MLLNQSQLYESQHQIDNIQDDEINHFISTLQQKWKDNKDMIHVGKMDLRDIQGKLEVFFGGNQGEVLGGKGEDGVGDGCGCGSEEGLAGGTDAGDMVDCEQVEKERDDCCKICHQQFQPLIPPLPKYSCTRCHKQFCENCLGRFIPNPCSKLLNETNQSSLEEQTHTQSVPICLHCDHQHLRTLMKVERERFLDFGRKVVNRIRNWNLELDLEICYERNSRKSDMDLMATSDTNPQHKLKNKLSSLILQNNSLKTQLSQTQSLLTYGHKINKQLTQKQMALQRKLSQSISEFPNKIRPPCPYESERAESQAGVLKDPAYQSILEDQSRLVVSHRRVCCVGCTVM